MFSPVIFDDLNFDFIPYTPFGAYGQSKTANALLAVGVTQRWQDEGILANAVNPGAIATGLQKHTGGLRTPVERRKTPEQGASTSFLLAASPLLDGTGGLYFEDCNQSPRITKRPTDFSGGVADYALDVANAERLWGRLAQADRVTGKLFGLWAHASIGDDGFLVPPWAVFWKRLAAACQTFAFSRGRHSCAQNQSASA